LLITDIDSLDLEFPVDDSGSNISDHLTGTGSFRSRRFVFGFRKGPKSAANE